ncbi:MAG: response regulator transcription factor [Planctomycetales bacterium]|nr:response regulator transcription factor [Planctomycetales bacterium]
MPFQTKVPDDFLFTAVEWRRLISSLDLPKRQSEILLLIVAGQADSEIAKKLSIGAPTVRTHIKRILDRFGARDRTTLVIEVFRRFRQLRS